MRSVAAVLAGFVTLSVSLYAMQGIGTAIMLRMYPELPDDGVVRQSKHAHVACAG